MRAFGLLLALSYDSAQVTSNADELTLVGV